MSDQAPNQTTPGPHQTPLPDETPAPHQPPVLVLLHGAGQSPPSWQDVVTSLNPQRRIHAPWLKGLKPTQAANFDLPTAVADLHANLDLRDWQVVDLAGVDLGGMVALRFAVEYPERVRKLVLINTPVLPSKRRLGLERTVLAMTPSKVIEAAGVTKKAALAALDAMRSADLTTDLGRLQTPTLAVVGADDEISKQAAETLASRAADVQVDEIPGRNGPLLRQDPAAVAAAIERFLQ